MLYKKSYLILIMPQPSFAQAFATSRRQVALWVETPPVQRFIIVLILLNAFLIGLETEGLILEAH